MEDSTGDPWGDEGFGGEDDWEAKESLETDIEDDDELEVSLEQLEEEELDADDELDDPL